MAGTRTTEHPRSCALFKADHPREIDHLIAFFGGQEASSTDMCDEALFDALTQRSSGDDEDEGSAEIVRGDVIPATRKRGQTIGPHGHDAVLNL